ncbi:hypothetical protein Cagg_2173 [Chloroflexus aggregans DSM 9485]|uniref:Uncharacterized protein n=1 Tax=Chloroflexus aggregans (strain MD-66 / DSM 9485) TaxID=326427 RepID=B8GCL2_CHLAD|nr:hypothetical protein Cagg_2173 [Chloroflexus aggregans DSM 9485]
MRDVVATVRNAFVTMRHHRMSWGACRRSLCRVRPVTRCVGACRFVCAAEARVRNRFAGGRGSDVRHATITPHGTLTFGQPFRFGYLAEPGVPRARPNVADRARRVVPSIGRCTVIVDRSRHCPSLLPASAYGYAKRSSVVAAHPRIPRRSTRLDVPEERRERLVNPFGQMRHRWGVNRVQRRTFRVHDGDAPLGVIPIRLRCSLSHTALRYASVSLSGQRHTSSTCANRRL